MLQRVTKERDFLFPTKSPFIFVTEITIGIQGDGRLSYYSDIESWSNIYAYQICIEGSYGHAYKNINIANLVCHDGSIISVGVSGGRNGAIYRQWQTGSDIDDQISMSINYRQVLHTKRVKNYATLKLSRREVRVVIICVKSLNSFGK